jgi:hypothetical protein
MKIATTLIAAAALVAGLSIHGLRASDASDRPVVGQIRALALAPASPRIADLHHQGWLEARGQLLDASSYPDLYATIGRTWTSERAPENQFAVPDVQDRSQRRASSDNPYGVLGPGDLVTSGPAARGWTRTSPISYWIFVGRDVTDVLQRARH